MNIDTFSRFKSLFFFNYKNSALEGVRGLAVLFVFHVHLIGSYQKHNYFVEGDFLLSLFKTLHAGHIGVDLFFVLSGYFIFKTISSNKPTFINFIKNRYLRLLPLVIFILLTKIHIILNLQPEIFFKILFDNITLLNLFGQVNLVNHVNWSLSYEVYFYLTAGVVLIHLPKCLSDIRILLSLISINIFIYNFVDLPFSLVRFNEFLFGVILAKLNLKTQYNKNKILEKPYSFVFILCLLPLLQFLWGNGFVDFNSNFHLTLFYTSVGVVAFSLYSMILSGNVWANSFFSFTPLRFLGAISYSFYITHSVIGIYYSKYTISYFIKSSEDSFIKNLLISIIHFSGNFSLLVIDYILALIITIVISMLTFLFLERRYFAKKHKIN